MSLLAFPLFIVAFIVGLNFIIRKEWALEFSFASRTLSPIVPIILKVICVEFRYDKVWEEPKVFVQQIQKRKIWQV